MLLLCACALWTEALYIPTDTSAADSNGHLAGLQISARFDGIGAGFSFANPEVMFWICEDANVGLD